MVLSAVADTVRGISRHVAARWSARSARLPGRIATKQTGQRDAMIAICNVVAVMDCTHPNVRKCDIVRRRSGLVPFGRQIWRFRSLIIQAECGTLAADHLLQSLLHEKGEAMKKTLMALAAVATLAVSAVVAPAPAHAQRGVAAGVAAGFIGGAIVGGALASRPVLWSGLWLLWPGLWLLRRPGLCRRPRLRRSCIWQRQRFWDGYGWRVRNVRVCD